MRTLPFCIVTAEKLIKCIRKGNHVKEQSLYSIGEFAKLCGVKKDTLFHYDEIGILKPEFIDPKNGYRYYSRRQILTFDIIACLKECQTPLKEIKNYMENRDTEYFLEILQKKEEELQKEQEKIVRMRSILQNTVQMTKEALKVKPGICWMENCAREHLIAVGLPEGELEETSLQALEKLYEILDEICLQKELTVGSMITRDHLLKHQFREDFYYGRIAEMVEHPQYLERPEGIYAVVYHNGSYETLPSSYEILLNYIFENGYRVIGNSYEQEMLNHLAEKDPGKYVLKISVPVEKSL